MTDYAKVVLSKAELEALEEAIRRRFQAPADAPNVDALEEVDAKVREALRVIAESSE